MKEQIQRRIRGYRREDPSLSRKLSAAASAKILFNRQGPLLTSKLTVVSKIILGRK